MVEIFSRVISALPQGMRCDCPYRIGLDHNYQKWRKMKRLLISLVLLSLLLTGCSAGSAKDEAGNDIATYANPLADNLIAGILARDYATFFQRFRRSHADGHPGKWFPGSAEII